MGDRNLTLAEARKMLDSWASMYRSRDKIVRLAAAAGVSTAEIARRTDLARSTIYVILKTQEKPR